MDKNAVYSGPGISDEIMLTFSQKRQQPSVTIGEGIQHDVASFYAEIYPWFMNPELVEEYIDNEDLDLDDLDPYDEF